MIGPASLLRAASRGIDERAPIAGNLHSCRKATSQRFESGFTYVMILAGVVIAGIVIEAAQLTTWRVLQADREAELLFRGHAYKQAIQSFYQSSGRFPRTMEELLTDPSVAERHHIRMLYSDPVSKGEDKSWRLIRSGDGGISGVVSRSNEDPLKRANFPKEFEKFEKAKSYSDWVFEYVPPPRSQAAQPPSGGNPGGSSPPALKTY